MTKSKVSATGLRQSLSLLTAVCAAFTTACEPFKVSSMTLNSQGMCQSSLNTTSTSGNFSISKHSMVMTVDEITEQTHDVYETRSSPGKGFGMFARKYISRGTQIMIEESLFQVKIPEMVPGKGYIIANMISDIETAFQLLSPENQQEFLQLHDFRHPTEADQNKLLTIFRSNAYNTGKEHIGLFPKTARINHSCRPNSGNFWSEKKGWRVIYATRNIVEGEEITASYIPLLKSTKQRQVRLEQYGFTCDCAACKSEESDKRRGKISDLLDSLEQKQLYSPSKKLATNEKRLVKALSLIEMIKEESVADYLARAYHLAAAFNQRTGRAEYANTWARRELEMHQWAEQDSEESLKTIAFLEELDKQQ